MLSSLKARTTRSTIKSYKSSVQTYYYQKSSFLFDKKQQAAEIWRNALLKRGLSFDSSSDYDEDESYIDLSSDDDDSIYILKREKRENEEEIDLSSDSLLYDSDDGSQLSSEDDDYNEFDESSNSEEQKETIGQSTTTKFGITLYDDSLVDSNSSSSSTIDTNKISKRKHNKI